MGDSMERKHWKLKWYNPLFMFAILTIPFLFINIHRTTGGAISDILQDYYGVGTASVALLASSYLYAYMVIQIPAGLVTDRVGPRKCICASLMVIAFSTFLCSYSAMVSNFDLMVVGKAMIGLSAAFFIVPSLKAIATWFSNERFATADGTFMFIGNIGTAIAAAPMVIMFENVGISQTYIILSAIFLLTSFLCWLMIHVHSDKGPNRVVEPKKYSPIVSLKMVLTSGRRFWAIGLVGLLLACSMVWSTSQAGAFYCSVYGFSLEDAGLMVTLYGIGYAVACPIAGSMADFVFRSRKKVLYIGSISTMSFWVIILLMTNFKLFDSVPIQGIINFGFGIATGLDVVMFSLVRCLFPLEITGTSLSLFNILVFLGGATTILFSGILIPNKTAGEYAFFWGIMVIISFLALIFSLIAMEEKYGVIKDH